MGLAARRVASQSAGVERNQDSGARPVLAGEHYAHYGAWHIDLPPLSLPDMLRQAAAQRGNHPLVDFLGRTYSYNEIWRAAEGFAAGLQKRGLGRGDRIGLYLPNVPLYVAAYFGALLAGATVVNFSPLYSAEELEAQVANSGTRVLVTVDSSALLPTALEVLDHSPLENLVVARLPDMLPRLKGWAMRLFARKQLTAIPARADVTAWQDYLSSQAPTAVPIDPQHDIALLQYTGGTTGTPKGAMLTHQNLTANARQIRAIDPDQGRRDMVLGVLPLFHVFANTCILNRTIANGGCIAMLPRFEAGQVLATIGRVRPTSLFAVPTMYQALLDHPQLKDTDFSSLRETISGGAPLPLPLKRRFEEETGVKVVEGYGLTESSGVVSTNPLHGENREGTIGQVLPLTRVRLLDKEDPLRDPPGNEPGELAINGPQVMQGYWNRPDAAATAFVERDGERWFRTGDIATFDTDGFIRIVDRLKDMINVGGFKVFPSTLEKHLVEHPSVKEALVIGVPDDYLGERPRAYVTLTDDGPPVTGDDLLAWLKPHIGKHERIESVVIRDSLPKTPIGKLDRKALVAEVLGASSQ
ncbi:putative long-chain-fatty-acid--CoA ligase [Caenibius tardaugens NBRC 16725]|uniref:Putative long-chain-fatty-acid--CoA ligase n=1 Tax=Caenibius tardaugens NBRC 16725 TaxID=1219035 RepID=U2YK97_9SPHN|nr:putative long-chain-fatty-acid--CoA ligase [Caenibius tardaugens NBRC 16725]